MKTTEIVYGWALGKDCERLAKLSRAGEIPVSQEDWEKYLRSKDGIVRVAAVDGRIVGYCATKVNDKGTEITSICVSSLHRRQGIATQLVRQIKRSRGPVVVTVPEISSDLIGLFVREGFRSSLVRNWSKHYDGIRFID